MLKNFYLVTLLILGSTFVGAANYITGDTIRSPDRTKTWTLPATSGALVKSTDNIATATALAANPSPCASDRYVSDIDANGTLTCVQVTNAGLAGSIAASKLVGSDIATVGTIGTGTWQGTAISPTYGGTGQNSSAASGIPHVASGTWSFPAYVQIAEQSTPATPASGFGRAYFKSDGKLYQLNDDGVESAVGAGGGSNFNVLANPDWASNTNNWTASGGTYTRTTTSGQYAGLTAGAASWDSSSASQTLTSDAVTVPAEGGNWTATCKIKTATGTATHKLQAYDGTNVLNEVTITSSTAAFPSSIIVFPSPTSGTIALRLISVASNEPTIYVDDCYLGPSERFNIGSLVGLIPSKVTSLTSGTSATYTVTVGTKYLRVRMVGGGGGGGGNGTSGAGNGGNGGATSFGVLSAGGGGGGPLGSAAGSNASCTASSSSLGGVTLGIIKEGGYGAYGSNSIGTYNGGIGGISYFGGGSPGGPAQNFGTAAIANSGSGGGGAGGTGSVASAAGGCAGGYIEALFVNPSSTYTYTVGAGGTQGAQGTGGGAGGIGGSGYIEVIEYSADPATAMNPALVKAPTVTRLTSGTAQTYTVPAGVTHLEVEVVGGGAGGGGGGTTGTVTAGNNGTTSTFGTSLISATGASASCTGGTPGSGSVSAPAIQLVAQRGAHAVGFMADNATSAMFGTGGSGAPGPLGGGNGLGGANAAGTAATANTGAGGGGGGFDTNAAGQYACAGGAAGGYAKALITNPAPTYTYTVGPGGTGGGAGTNGFAGADGGSGIIIVTEYYGYNAPQLINGVVSRDNSTGTTTINTVVAKTTTYTATTNEETITADATGGAFTISLPPAATVKGKKFAITQIGSTQNVVTIDPNSSETVCEFSTIMLSGTYDAVVIQSDGTKWIGIGDNSCRKTFSFGVNTTSCTLDFASGNYSSMTNNGSSNCTFTPKGLNSGPVGCAMNIISTGTQGACRFTNASPASTAIRFECTNYSGTAVAVQMEAVCHAYR